MKKILALIILNFIFSNLENSEFYYIDQIDSIKELEFLHQESLNLGDTIKSINIFFPLSLLALFLYLFLRLHTQMKLIL